MLHALLRLWSCDLTLEVVVEIVHERFDGRSHRRRQYTSRETSNELWDWPANQKFRYGVAEIVAVVLEERIIATSKSARNAIQKLLKFLLGLRRVAKRDFPHGAQALVAGKLVCRTTADAAFSSGATASATEEIFTIEHVHASVPNAINLLSQQSR
mgnify:CR=1 FL=1